MDPEVTSNPAGDPVRHRGTGARLKPGTDRLLVVFSDVEMGAGGPTDDFPQTDYFAGLLHTYNLPPYDRLPVTFVANGDTFDLLKTSVDGVFPPRITAEVALAKLERVISAHASFFDQLGSLLRHRAAERRLVFVAGNHDLELLFPEVQARLRDRIGVPEAIEFAGHVYETGDVRIEHGSQKDPMFTADPEEPFVLAAGKTILNIPWGTVALLEVAMPLNTPLYALDRLRPRRLILKLLPEVRELLLEAYQQYWTHDYWRELFSKTDELHRISWKIVKEVVYRFSSGDPELAGTDAYGLIKKADRFRTYVLGHQHSAGYWSQEGRRVLQTGCFRNEFLFDESGSGNHELLPKVYAEVLLKEGRTLTAHLVEVDAPGPRERAVPRHLDEVLPEVRRLLELARS